MKLAIVFHKNPLVPPTGIDLVRLRAIAGGLLANGVEVDVLAPVDREALMAGAIPVRPLHCLAKGRYDIVKTCYHFSIELIGDYEGPVVSRIVRVVDEHLPERDAKDRDTLLRCQDKIRRRAAVLVVNNVENQRRWLARYGSGLPVELVPNGCPRHIPAPGQNPFDPATRNLLFLGSIAAPRMVTVLNALAVKLAPAARVHVVGLNKARWYGGTWDCRLDPAIVEHGQVPETDIWNYIHHADVGLALATGPHGFDNDLSKIYSYLRGGLPVLAEAPVLNNPLIVQTGLGKIVGFDDPAALVAGALWLLHNPPTAAEKSAAMTLMAQAHCWQRRVKRYVRLFTTLCG